MAPKSRPLALLCHFCTSLSWCTLILTLLLSHSDGLEGSLFNADFVNRNSLIENQYENLEKAMAPDSITLAWKIPWTEEPGRLPSMGSRRVGHDWATSLSLSTFHFLALEKEMATHSSVLAWRIPGTGEPGGLPSMGSHRVGHDWSDLAAAWKLEEVLVDRPGVEIRSFNA